MFNELCPSNRIDRRLIFWLNGRFLFLYSIICLPPTTFSHWRRCTEPVMRSGHSRDSEYPFCMNPLLNMRWIKVNTTPWSLSQYLTIVALAIVALLIYAANESLWRILAEGVRVDFKGNIQIELNLIKTSNPIFHSTSFRIISIPFAEHTIWSVTTNRIINQ